MVDANLSRGGFDIDLPLIGEPGEQVSNVTIGKPNQQIHNTGSLNPRFTDQRSGIREHQLLGRLTDSSDSGDGRKQAYATAANLADLIKSGLNGSPITLNIPLDEYDSNLSVVPQAGQDAALTLEYEPGAPANVGVQLGLSQVDRVLGTVNQTASTPTTTGSGPIQIIGPSSTIDVVQDVSISRQIGRPNSEIGTDTAELPYYTDRRKTAYDAFEIRFQSSDPSGTVKDIADMFTNQLANNPLTLDFNGLYGLGSFSVTPQGSDGLRHIRTTGIEGEVVIPAANLRVVQ